MLIMQRICWLRTFILAYCTIFYEYWVFFRYYFLCVCVIPDMKSRSNTIPQRLVRYLQSVRPCGAQAGRMLVLRETTSCSSAVTVKVEPPLRTDGWASSTCCLSGKKSRAAFWRVPKKKEVSFSVEEGGRGRCHEVYSCVCYQSTFWIARGRGTELVLGWFTSSARRCGLQWSLSLSLGSEEESHGRTGEGGAPSAPSVPVPRPVARGLANRRQVRVPRFTHGALNPLRMCEPWEHHIYHLI